MNHDALEVATLLGHRDLPTALRCLASFARYSTEPVRLRVHDDGTLEPREVETGVKSDRWIEVRSGVEPGETVATQANFLIDSESRLKAALSEMSGAGHQHGQ